MPTAENDTVITVTKETRDLVRSLAMQMDVKMRWVIKEALKAYIEKLDGNDKTKR